jgi:hypothetical protein
LRVGGLVGVVAGGLVVLSLSTWPRPVDWDSPPLAERSYWVTTWYVFDPFLFMLAFLVGPVAAWGLARRWAPAVAPSLIVIVLLA